MPPSIHTPFLCSPTVSLLGGLQMSLFAQWNRVPLKKLLEEQWNNSQVAGVNAPLIAVATERWDVSVRSTCILLLFQNEMIFPTRILYDPRRLLTGQSLRHPIRIRPYQLALNSQPTACPVHQKGNQYFDAGRQHPTLPSNTDLY